MKSIIFFSALLTLPMFYSCGIFVKSPKLKLYPTKQVLLRQSIDKSIKTCVRENLCIEGFDNLAWQKIHWEKMPIEEM
jgi:hypothetical protein